MILTFSVPLTPPTVNMYVRHTRKGRHYQSAEAIRFKEAVAIFAKGRSVDAKHYLVSVIVYLGKGERLDVDNGNKCILDGLKDAGVIRSDAKVKKLIVEMGRDWVNPRTDISIEPF